MLVLILITAFLLTGCDTTDVSSECSLNIIAADSSVAGDEILNFQTLCVPFDIYGFEGTVKQKEITFVCPREWLVSGSDVNKDGSEYSKIIECMLRPADMVRETLESFPEAEEKILGNCTFTVTFEERSILEKPNWQLYHIWSYYYFEGDKCYSIRFFQNQDTPAMTAEDFENMLVNAKIG